MLAAPLLIRSALHSSASDCSGGSHTNSQPQIRPAVAGRPDFSKGSAQRSAYLFQRSALSLASRTPDEPA